MNLGCYRNAKWPCGKCELCRLRKSEEWANRILLEMHTANRALFVTLTYDERSIGEGELQKRHLQAYLKRIRKFQKNLRYFACGEYGSQTQRPHYHAILLNTEPEMARKKWETPETSGFVHIGTVTPSSIRYVTRYMLEVETPGKKTKPFRLMSKGLGQSIFKDPAIIQGLRERMESYITWTGGKRIKLPRYITSMIFNEKERSEINVKTQKYIESKKEGQTKKDIALKFHKARADIRRRKRLT